MESNIKGLVAAGHEMASELKAECGADYEAELGMERGGFSDALNEIKTPATDAFLAEVRAQGVEMFAQKCNSKSEQSLASDIRDNWKLLGEHAADFADELRKGGNQ